LLFAFIESIAVFLVVSLLGFFISTKWKEKRRNALLGILVLITSLWAILSYLYFLVPFSISGETIIFLANLAHPLRFIYEFSLVVVTPTIIVPTYFVLRSENFLRGVRGFFERLSLLTLFYLFFDFVGLIIVIIRNV